MSWEDKTVIRILLIVAQLIAQPEWKAEIKTLATHIIVGDLRARLNGNN